MTLFIWIVVWVITSRAAFVLLRLVWLYDWDWTRADRRAMTILSLAGPISLFSAALIWVLEKPPSEKAKEVLIPKKVRR